ncbi:hypothetical protein D3C75_532800 [compost metagenome]
MRNFCYKTPVVFIVVLGQDRFAFVIRVLNSDTFCVKRVVLAFNTVLEFEQVLRLAQPFQVHPDCSAFFIGGFIVNPHDEAERPVGTALRLLAFRNTCKRRHDSKLSVRVIGQRRGNNIRIVGQIESKSTCFAGNELRFDFLLVSAQIEFFINEAVIVLIVHIAQPHLCILSSKVSYAQIRIQRTILGVDWPVTEGIVIVEAIGCQAAPGYTESGFFPFSEHLVVLLKGSQILNLHAHLLYPVFADKGSEVISFRTGSVEENILVVYNTILLDGLTHTAPIGRRIILNLSPVQRLHNILTIVSKRLRHIVVEDDIRSFVRCQQLLIVNDFTLAGNRNKVNINVVFVTELCLHPAGVVVIRNIPAFERTLIDRDIKRNLVFEAL